MSCSGSISALTFHDGGERYFGGSHSFESFDALVDELERLVDNGDEIFFLTIDCGTEDTERSDAEKDAEAKQVEAGLERVAKVLASGSRGQIDDFNLYANNNYINFTPLLHALSTCDVVKGRLSLTRGSFFSLDGNGDSSRSNSSLKSLRICGVTFKERAVPVLGLFRGIEDFGMTACSFPNDAPCPDMKEVLESYSETVSSLSFDDMFGRTKNTWLRHLPFFLPQCHELKKLELRNQTRAEGPFLKELHLALGACAGLEELTIDLGDEDMLHCFNALSSLKALKQLKFTLYAFRDTGVTGALVKFLESRSLTHFSCFHFSPEALKLFIHGLAHMKGLQQVLFSHFSRSSIITDPTDAEALIASVEKNTTLTELSGLEFNFGSDSKTAPAGAQDLESLFEERMKLRLTGNRLGRPLFSDSSTSDALRAKILAFYRHDANAMFYLLRKMPSVACEKTVGYSATERFDS